MAELIEGLPPEDKALLEGLLANPGYSDDRIAKALREDGYGRVTGNMVYHYRRKAREEAGV